MQGIAETVFGAHQVTVDADCVISRDRVLAELSQILGAKVRSPPGLEDQCDMHAAKPEEYQVLLQNLPKAVLKEGMLRAMVKEAKLRDVKKLAFRSDGKALITLTSSSALRKCIEHFNGLPWFHAPTCAVPSIIATHVQTAKSSKKDVAQLCQASKSSADVIQLAARKIFTDASVITPSSDKMHASDGCSSRDVSTDSGLSSDEASCDSDSEPEAQLIAA